jgi:hypothetical protein
MENKRALLAVGAGLEPEKQPYKDSATNASLRPPHLPHLEIPDE